MPAQIRRIKPERCINLGQCQGSRWEIWFNTETVDSLDSRRDLARIA